MTEFGDNCVERAISRLDEDFPEEAALLRANTMPQISIHSKNGWMTRVMGSLLEATVKSVARMRTPDYTDVECWFDNLGLAQLANSERGAWGRQASPKKEIIREEKTWMRDHDAPPYLCQEAQIWWRHKNTGGLWTKVCMVPCFLRDAPAEVARLKVGQDHNEFLIEELSF